MNDAPKETIIPLSEIPDFFDQHAITLEEKERLSRGEKVFIRDLTACCLGRACSIFLAMEQEEGVWDLKAHLDLEKEEAGQLAKGALLPYLFVRHVSCMDDEEDLPFT